MRSQTPAAQSPVEKQSSILILHPPQLTLVGMFSSQPGVQGILKWDLPGNGKHKHKQPLSLQLIALNKSLFCLRGGGEKQKLIHG